MTYEIKIYVLVTSKETISTVIGDQVEYFGKLPGIVVTKVQQHHNYSWAPKGNYPEKVISKVQQNQPGTHLAQAISTIIGNP